MAFSAQMSREHQLWSLNNLSDQVKARDTDGQKQFARTLGLMSHRPLHVSDDLLHLAERKGYLLVQANTTRLDTALVYQRDAYGIKLYEKQVGAINHGGVLVVQGVSTGVAGSVASILETFTMNTSKSFTTTMQTLLPSIVCQGATVASDKDKVHVHWMSLVGLHDDHRLSDMLFLSASQLYEPSVAQYDDDIGDDMVTTTTAANASCGTHIWESVDATTTSSSSLQSLALFGPHDTKCMRLNVRNCGFFIETNHDTDDMCRVTFTFSCHLTGGTTSRSSNPCETTIAKARQWMQGMVVTGLQQLAATCRASHLQLVPRHQWALANHCTLCAKSFRFNVLRRRHHCRLCGQSICSTCSTFVTLDTLDASCKVAPVDSVRCCLLCAFSDQSSKSHNCRGWPNHDPEKSKPIAGATRTMPGPSTRTLSKPTTTTHTRSLSSSTFQQQQPRRVPSAASLAPTTYSTTAGSSLRDSLARLSMTPPDNMVPYSPTRQGSRRGHRRLLSSGSGSHHHQQQQQGLSPDDYLDVSFSLSYRPRTNTHNDPLINVEEQHGSSPSCNLPSPVIRHSSSMIELTRVSSLNGRRSLHAEKVGSSNQNKALHSHDGRNSMSSSHFDRHARRAAMMERSHSFLETAMLKQPRLCTLDDRTPGDKAVPPTEMLHQFGLSIVSKANEPGNQPPISELPPGSDRLDDDRGGIGGTTYERGCDDSLL
ncbi:hypothetical protein DYB36_008113 [Aphanomyces astaci]|uniref:FYVE-type domain-containing protein n=1 Tax=Aphanomyces astaci TaxID=112090 RepID=A0A397A2H6_APHAT|nr:hypothetical protein DYB36_008113 [Aphanomyces astaci]